jgi:hypothetical protein
MRGKTKWAAEKIGSRTRKLPACDGGFKQKVGQASRLSYFPLISRRNRF